jgi:peptidoglycan/LPS O-acetylase OafA/YrhL
MAEHLRPLTSLRFFAAFWVVLYHYWPNLSATIPTVVEKGYLGVELFFILSGFILCHVYLDAAGEKKFRYGPFLWARLARVYPLHIATLLGVGLLAVGATAAGLGIDPNILSWASLPANLTLTQAWGLAPVAGWNHPSWSISAEWFAYLTFPAYAWAAWRLKDKPQVALVGGIALIFALYAVFERAAGFPLTQATIAWGALRIVPCFAYGCAIYLAWRAGATDRRAVAWTVLVGSLLGIIGLSIEGGPDAAIVSLSGLLILALAGLSKGGAGFLSSRFGVWLGEISYAVYMVCVPWKLVFPNLAAKVLNLQDKELPLWAWLVFLAGVIPLAALAHHLIEKPAREHMRGWSARLFRERTSTKLA